MIYVILKLQNYIEIVPMPMAHSRAHYFSSFKLSIDWNIVVVILTYPLSIFVDDPRETVVITLLPFLVQDNYAIQSNERGLCARDGGVFSWEIVPVCFFICNY